MVGKLEGLLRCDNYGRSVPCGSSHSTEGVRRPDGKQESGRGKCDCDVLHGLLPAATPARSAVM